jgi:hypothetical protein
MKSLGVRFFSFVGGIGGLLDDSLNTFGSDRDDCESGSGTANTLTIHSMQRCVASIANRVFLVRGRTNPSNSGCAFVNEYTVRGVFAPFRHHVSCGI